MDTFCFFVTWQKHQSNPSTENQLSKSFLVHIVVWCTTETEHTATWLIDLGNGSPEQPCFCHCLASLTYNRTSDTIMTQRYRLQHQRVQWKVSLSKYVQCSSTALVFCWGKHHWQKKCVWCLMVLVWWAKHHFAVESPQLLILIANTIFNLYMQHISELHLCIRILFCCLKSAITFKVLSIHRYTW